MEKAKIDLAQLFSLMTLFQLGTSIVLPIGIDAENNAWIAIILSCFGGLLLFFINYQLFSYYPNQQPCSYFKDILGSVLSRILSYIYLVYFTYLTARVLRDFGELLATFAYRETPVIFINALMILTIVYGVGKGIEVIARTGQLNMLIMILMAILGLLLIVFTGLIQLQRLNPKLGTGLMGILKTIGTQTLYVPFGELVAFSYIYPYLNNPKFGRRVGIGSILFSGIGLSVTMAINIAVLSSAKVAHSPFPLLATIQQIEFGDILERLDVLFLIALFIGAFFKISIFFYVSSMIATHLYKLPSHKEAVFPLALVILFLSMSISGNYAEHLMEGLKLVPYILHLPMQVIVPCLLFLIAFFKKRRKKETASHSEGQSPSIDVPVKN